MMIFALLGGMLAACGGGGGDGVTVTVPAAPTNLQATTASASAIDLVWTDSSGNEEGFRVYRGTTSTTVTNLVATPGAGVTGYTDNGLAASTLYYYKVTAINAAGESGASNVANATTQPPPVTPPTAPSNLVATPASSSVVNLAWTDTSGNEEGFRVLRGTGASPPGFTQIGADLGANATAYSDNTASARTTYVYRVLAFNSAGVSLPAESLPVTTPDSLITVEGGNEHSLALMEDGTVRAWGSNTDGALGVGKPPDNSLVPITVPGLTGVVAVSGGDGHTLALMNNGRIKGWGQNFFGGVGSGDNVTHLTPVDVVGLNGVGLLENVSAVSAGGFYSIALRNNGEVWAWGSGEFGQLGTGSIANRLTPVRITGLTGVMTAISAGQNHTLALRNDGTVWAWGNNSQGQVGKGTFSDVQLTPIQVLGLTGAVAISTGESHSLALMNDGTVRAWGGNFFGELGDGTTTRKGTPVPVIGLNNVVAISAGGFFSVALRNDGTVWAWGSGDRGQIGDGTTTNRATPVSVSGLDNVQAISAAKDHTLAKRNGKSVWAWGSNEFGQIGDGTSTNRLVPVPSSGF